MSLEEKLKELGSKVMGRQNEAVAADVEEETIEFAEGTEGTAVDWTQYEIPADHLYTYRRSRFLGGEWRFDYTHYTFVTSSVGKMGQEIELLVNSAEGWRLGAVQAHGSGMLTASLTRTTRHVLPKPEKVASAEVTISSEPEEGVDAWVESNKA